MQFVLTGFTQDIEFRVFAFEAVAGDRTRTPFTVRMDMALSRRYGIRIQELPLLCLGLLERRDEAEQANSMTFPEEGMRLHADTCAAERDAAAKKKSMRRIHSNQTGAGWRAP